MKIVIDIDPNYYHEDKYTIGLKAYTDAGKMLVSTSYYNYNVTPGFNDCINDTLDAFLEMLKKFHNMGV